MSERAIFMDRDGTVCEEVGYVNHPTRCRLLSRSAEAVRRINGSDFRAIVVTNQAGVARGYFDEEMIHEVHRRLRNLLEEQGARLDGIYYCPHHPEVGPPPYRRECDCRKPEPGMLLTAARSLGADPARTAMIGDTGADMEAARRAGLRGVLVPTAVTLADEVANASEVASDLAAAVDRLLGAAAT